MNGYTFAKKNDIEGVLDLLADSRRPRRSVGRPRTGLAVDIHEPQRISEGFIYFTPSGGIPGRSGTTPGLAECSPWFINTVTGELEELTDDNGNTQGHDVYHIGESAVGGNRFIQAKMIFGTLVADMEDC